MEKDTQEQLFHDIIRMKLEIQGLANFVANDFESMLADGSIDKEGICLGIKDMHEAFYLFIQKTKELHTRCENIMQKAINEN